MRGSMEHEASGFESSEMLAAYLASTPLLEESWRMCFKANTAAQQSFAVNRVGTVTYVAFSGVQTVDCSEESCRSLVDMETGADGIFGAFCCGRREEEEEDQRPIMIHGGILQLFLFFYRSSTFQRQMHQIMNESKSVVVAGHSLGGSMATMTALWLLSLIQSTCATLKVLCITYGSPMLGNEAFSQALRRERWDGNFCHIVAPYDVVPRMLFAPATPLMGEFLALFQFWQTSMADPSFAQFASQIHYEIKGRVFDTILSYTKERARGDEVRTTSFCPSGSYMFCTDKGVICLDNRAAIVTLLYLTFANGSADSFVMDHLNYGDYIGKVCWQYLQKKSLTDAGSSKSSSEAGIALALQASGIYSQEPMYGTAKDCLAIARHSGCKRSLNNAKMAVSLAKFTPLRAQIEWYKTYCDESDDQMGYYDAFKRRTASKRGSKVNINRLRLGQFWDDLINMLETNQLTHDFHNTPKYVNASQFYKLLVEPLEIAEYYRTLMHKKKGHYIEHGRPKRFKVFDKWWRSRKVGDEESNPRSRFASLTQDSCFWAQVEEARDSIYLIAGHMDPGKHSVLLEKVEKFEQYTRGMIERKEVSVDVLAKNSSYSLFLEEWRELKSQLQLLPPRFPASQDNMVQDIILEGDDTYL
ncbi:lipase-like PAD4 [Andrographis paniculata]|uniref:lipase-like PAD4 n=1 Tax=Andrographis paniculata TaxID=175694 RepID=UPI0021E8DF7F|nr:lipase-like PAD4 [Andrographis paniculata]